MAPSAMEHPEVVSIDTIYGCFLSIAGDLVSQQLRDYSAHTRNEIAMVRSFLRPRDIVLDIGAHIGTFAIPLARAQPGVRVYAFEPEPFLHDLLAKNVAANGLASSITAHNMVVSDRPGRFRAEALAGNTMTSTYLPLREGEESSVAVTAVSVDELIAAGRLPEAVDLIKVDTEGAECQVLRSCDALIRRCAPVIYAEINENALRHFGSTPDEVEALLLGWGYDFYRNAGERNSRNDAFRLAPLRRLREGGGFFDVLAIHRASSRHP
jgi:FkbM family methyltransferase